MLRKRIISLGLFTALGLVGTLLAPRQAEAFCGFYVAGADAKLFNDATVVVLMRDGTRTVLSMQNAYQGPPEDFALVIPVPVVLQEDDVKILRKELFERVDRLAAPRLVEYWEIDPCAQGGLGLVGTGRGGGGYGSGTGAGFGGRGSGSSVKIEAQFEVGEYEIVILSATESNGLDAWLRDNGYNIPEGAEPLLRPYVEQGSKFFVAKVDPAKVAFASDGRAMLSPLRFHYDSEDFALPVRLGLINAPDPEHGGKQDLLIHILAPELRYQAANYPNVTIPTNLDLQDSAKQQFGEFYVSLFDHTLEQTPGAIVTEYAWGAGNCDPCPGEGAPLTNQELLELGADVLPGWSDLVGQSGSGVSPVRMDEPTVSGPLDESIVRRIGRMHQNELRACYNSARARRPSLGGKLDLVFEIDAAGLVTSSEIENNSSIDDEALLRCLGKAPRRWKFPKPDAAVKVVFPLHFAPVRGGLGAGSFVLTRLHARYDATALGEDLVFEAAEAITGGRELRGPDGALERGAVPEPGGFNNFQARYAIRHAWAGEIACEEPIRGRWAGPPGGGETPPAVARQLGAVGRGASLGSFITESASAQLGGVAVIGSSPESKPEPGEPESPSEATPSATPEASKPAGGCACSIDANQRGGVAPGLLGLIGLLGLRRRR